MDTDMDMDDVCGLDSNCKSKTLRVFTNDCTPNMNMDGFDFTLDECMMCGLLGVLWTQYVDTERSIRISIPSRDLYFIHTYIKFENRKSVPTTISYPVIDPIDILMGDTWYGEYFRELTFEQCISLHRSCDYIGLSDLFNIISLHTSYLLNTDDSIKKSFLSQLTSDCFKK
jgi:hypothetical protein